MKSASTPAIEALYQRETRRSIVHALVLLGGKGDFKQIKKQLESTDIYTKSDKFEEELLAVATESRTLGSTKVSFKLKEEAYLSWFEPYYYLQPESQVKVHEVFQQGSLKEKKLVNEILGDYQGTYSYTGGVNKAVREAIAQSPALAKIVLSVLSLWCAPASS